MSTLDAITRFQDRARFATLPALVLLAFASTACHRTSNREDIRNVSVADIEFWNGLAIDTSGVDHMPSDQGPPHVFGEQLGPCRASRAMAIVHVAMFEALNAFDGSYESLLGLPAAPAGASARAAIAQAAHDTLAALFPSQGAAFASALASELTHVADGAGEDLGRAVGRDAAAAILAMRANDGADHAEPRIDVDWFCNQQPAHWRPDPIAQHQVALGARWSSVTPFVMQSAEQFRIPPPPATTSPDYTLAYNEVLVLGGDGVVTPTLRTAEQTMIGIYWAYDGTPSLCAPPRLYNQVALTIAAQQGTRGIELARLLALVNVAMADAGIAAWESKYHWDLWRPVTGIRESDPGTGPTGWGDGNPATFCYPDFVPLGAPASNASGADFTPPFPAYPSGHATFGGALFQTLRRFYGTDDIAFTFVSDEFDGVTRDRSGNLRPLLERSFASLSEAEEENGQSRIYLGIHWAFDKTEGIRQGRNVGDWVFDRLFVRR